ncbi:hypothetical protein [Rugamonas aquatica]|uniref:Uncharacterized protein n=1 Tax=Rugamonas aquatica TaxID=2743357 RepID=A0A6A7NCR7_9BURK|nr:hypothetical protein [Rugamonas aquatica]MQA42157.1 hypothetical protein [Rugamonas aquatica]
MSILPALGARTLPASLYGANPHNDGKTAGTSAARQVKPVDSSPISLSNDGLEKHVASVGNSTVDFAQDFLGSFAKSLFGDAAKDAVINFDSASLDASSTLAVGVQHSSGPNGSSDAAAFQLTDSSHFIGKGTITTADGRKFDFEVEVQYDAELSGAASQTTSTNSDKANSDKANDAAAKRPVASNGASADNLPTVQVPNIDFPGTLADLFKLIGRDLQSALSTGDNSPSKTSDGIDRNTLRSLSLRLLNLVDSKDTNTYTAPTAADKAKSVADAYGSQTAAPQPGTNAGTSATPAPADDPISLAPAANDAAPGAKDATS